MSRESVTNLFIHHQQSLSYADTLYSEHYNTSCCSESCTRGGRSFDTDACKEDCDSRSDNAGSYCRTQYWEDGDRTNFMGLELDWSAAFCRNVSLNNSAVHIPLNIYENGERFKCPSVCLSALSACLCVGLSACLSVCLSACLSVCLPVCLPVCLICLPDCLFICPTVCSSADSSVLCFIQWTDNLTTHFQEQLETIGGNASFQYIGTSTGLLKFYPGTDFSVIVGVVISAHFRTSISASDWSLLNRCDRCLKTNPPVDTYDVRSRPW